MNQWNFVESRWFFTDSEWEFEFEMFEGSTNLSHKCPSFDENDVYVRADFSRFNCMKQITIRSGVWLSGIINTSTFDELSTNVYFTYVDTDVRVIEYPYHAHSWLVRGTWKVHRTYVDVRTYVYYKDVKLYIADTTTQRTASTNATTHTREMRIIRAKEREKNRTAEPPFNRRGHRPLAAATRRATRPALIYSRVMMVAIFVFFGRS